uniref:Uncharacterized protein n=1 Tax=Oryza rufipogon TaxID=4529 RepID=A0A0E0Q7A2_ORYRU
MIPPRVRDESAAPISAPSSTPRILPPLISSTRIPAASLAPPDSPLLPDQPPPPPSSSAARGIPAASLAPDSPMPLQSTAGPATPSSLLLPPPLSRVNARRSPSLDQRRRYRASTAGPPQSLHASSRVPAARHRIVCPCRRHGGSPSLTRRSSPEKPGPFSQTRSPETEKMNKRVERRKRDSRREMVQSTAATDGAGRGWSRCCPQSPPKLRSSPSTAALHHCPRQSRGLPEPCSSPSAAAGADSEQYALEIHGYDATFNIPLPPPNSTAATGFAPEVFD